MAQKVTVTLTCDLRHPRGAEVEGQENIRFSVNGTAYEVDVCEKHANDLRKAVGPFTQAARKVAAQRGSRPRRRSPGGASRSSDIRDWAKTQGIEVSERGRIPAVVVDKYEAAH